MSAGLVPFEPARENLFHISFQASSDFPAIFGIPWIAGSSLQPLSLCLLGIIIVCVRLPLVQTSPCYIDSRHINIDDLILTTFTMTQFPNKAIFYSAGY